MKEPACADGRQRHKASIALLFFALNFLGVLAAVLGVFVNNTWNWWIWNADALGQFTIASDLTSGGRLGSWNLGNATYLFPDLVFAFASNVFLPSVQGVVVSNIIFQLIFLTLAVLAYGKATLHPHPFVLTTLAVSGLLALAATVGEPFALLLASAHHGSSFAAGILLLAIVLRQHNSRKTHLLLLAVTVVLFAMSDDLFTISYAIPVACLASMLPKALVENRSQKVLVILGSAMTGRLIGTALPGDLNSLPRQISLSSIKENGVEIVDVVLFAESRTMALGIAVLGFTACSFYISAKFLNRRRDALPAGNAFPLVFMMALSAVTTIVPLLLGLGSPVAERYLLQIFFIPVIVLAAVLARVATTTQLLPVAGLIGSSFFFTAGIERGDAGPWHPWNTALSCVTDELDQSQSNQVITQYWDTHVLTLLDEGSRVFAQFLSSGEEYVNVTSIDWYSPDGWYDAAILSSYAGPAHTFSPDQFVTKSGSSISSVVCGPWTILTAGTDSLGFAAFHLKS